MDWKRDLGWEIPRRQPDRRECTVGPLLDRWAAQTPDKLFALFETGESWTYRETRELVGRVASGLADLGVSRGDIVLNWLPNGPDQLAVWLATNYLGAIHVPVAASARAGEIEHVIASSGARLLVTDATLSRELAGIEPGCLQRTIVFGAADTGNILRGAVEIVGSDRLEGTPNDVPPQTVEPHDTALVIYTSGTTGMPKGVCSPYAQYWMLAKCQSGYLDGDDRVLITTSLSHISAAAMVMAALYVNASVAIYSRFSVSRFWSWLRETGSTAVPGMGPAMMSMLLKAPDDQSDSANRLRIVNVRAPGQQVRDFAKRFGTDYFAAFGMSEASCITLSARNSAIDGSCGVARPGIDLRLVDESGQDVACGKIGEIAIRSSLAGTLSSGYLGDRAATARAWRDGWFHTGDLASRDAAGNLFFHDRSKDCIRRRGKNISSQEVEREALLFDSVLHAAVMAVDGEFEDQEILLVVEPLDGCDIDPDELTRHIATRLAAFKVPRFVCVRRNLPRTTFGKIRKFQLLNEIDLQSCWDRTMTPGTAGGTREPSGGLGNG